MTIGECDPKFEEKWKEGQEKLQSTDQPKITGYRELDREEIAMINGIKALGNQVGDFIRSLERVPTTDLRWLRIAQTDLQKGFMSLTRAVAQPTSF